jgi:hypothetical protein
MVMRIGGPAGMLDRAPELFRAPGDLARIGDQPVGIAAIDAVQLLDPVQIGEMLPVDDDVVAPAHKRDIP